MPLLLSVVFPAHHMIPAFRQGGGKGRFRHTAGIQRINLVAPNLSFTQQCRRQHVVKVLLSGRSTYPSKCVKDRAPALVVLVLRYESVREQLIKLPQSLRDGAAR